MTCDTLLPIFVFLSITRNLFSSLFILAIKEIKDILDDNIKLYCWNGAEEKLPADESWFTPLAPAVAQASAAQPTGEKGGFHDKLVYIYTSGTTGLPKAAVVTNSR